MLTIIIGMLRGRVSRGNKIEVLGLVFKHKALPMAPRNVNINVVKVTPIRRGREANPEITPMIPVRGIPKRNQCPIIFAKT